MKFEDQKEYTHALQIARKAFEEVYPEFFDKSQGAHGQVLEPAVSFAQTILNNASRANRVKTQETPGKDSKIEEVDMSIVEIWRKLWKQRSKFKGKSLELLESFNKQFESWEKGESEYDNPFSDKQEIVIMKMYDDLL